MNLDFDSIPDEFKNFKSGIGGNYAHKCPITKQSKAMNERVIIEIIEQDENRFKRDGIYLPESVIVNCDLLKGKILSVGEKAKKYNVKVGDVVLYDKASAYYVPPEIVGTLIITDVENIVYVLKE